MAARNFSVGLVFCFALLMLFLFFVPFPFMLEPVHAIEPCIPISFGNPPTSETLISAEEIDCYTFSGVPGNRIRVDVEKTSGAMTPYWQVRQPGGSVLCDWQIIGPSDCLLSSNGTYEVHVKDFGDTDTGAYRIFVQRVDDPVGCTSLIFGGSPVSGSIASAAQENCYTFDGAVGDVIRLDVEATSGALAPYWQVIQPNGVVVCDWEIIPPTDCILVSSGTHTVMIKDFAGTNTGTYRFYTQLLNAPEGCKPATFGAVPLAGLIASAARENCYQLSGNTGDIIRLDVEATSGSLAPYWQVIQPDGTIACDWEIIPPTDCQLLSAGTHTVMVRDFSGTKTGSYKFFVQKLNAPAGCVSLAYGGSAKERAITSAAQENCFRFNGTSGDQVEIHLFKTTGTLVPYWQVVQPDGTLICDWEIIGPSHCDLSTGGTHTIMVRDFSGTKSGKYYISICTGQTHCRLILVPLPVSTALYDGWILETSESSNKGGVKNSTATTFRLGDDAGRKQYRGILSFPTSSLPDDAVITKVILQVKKQKIYGGGNPVNIFQGFIADVKKGYFGTSSGLQSGDFQLRASRSCGPFKPVPKSNWYNLNLTCARAYLNKLTTNGGITQIRLRFKLDDNNNSIANYLSLYSGNVSAASSPQLIIEYYLP